MPEHLVPGTDIAKMFDILNDTIDKADAALPGSKDSAGKINGDITGDAATVGGKKADGTAGNIPLLDGGGKLPLSVMPAIGNGSPGVTNYIASGGKVASVSGLTVTHGAIEASISGVTVKRDAGDQQTVQAKRHGLLTIDKTGMRGIRYADDPVSFIDDNTVAMWKPDGSVTCPNLAVGKSKIAVANDLTRQGGMVPVDGLFGGDAAQGNGTNGFYAVANLAGFPIGAAARQIDMLVTIGNITTTRFLCYYGGVSTTGDGFGLSITNARLYVSNDGYLDTSFDLSAGATYLVSVSTDGTNITLSINGQQVWKGAATIATTTANVLRLLTSVGAAYFSSDTIHYVEVRNAMRTPQQIAEIANKLCLPNSYDKTAATYPTISAVDKATAYHEWKFDETSGTAVADSAGTLNGTATGTTIIDSALDLGKMRRFNGSSDRITVGSYTSLSQCTMIAVVNWNGTASAAVVAGNYNGTGNTGYSLGVYTDGRVAAFSAVNAYSTSKLQSGKSAFIALTAAGSSVSFYVDSTTPETQTWTVPAGAVNAFTIGATVNASGFFGGDIEYIAVIPRALSQDEITVMYKALMSGGRKNITATLPVDTTAVAYFRSGASGVLTYNDADWQYGRREKAFGGNRRVRLTPKYFNGTTTLWWANPFGTRRVKVTCNFAQYANGANETASGSYYYSGSNDSYVINRGPSANVIMLTVFRYAGQLNSLDTAVGYLIPYVEVLEDDD